VFCAVIFISCGARNAEAGGASLYLSPNNGTFNVGSTFDVSVFVNTGDQNANAVKVEFKFDPKKLQLTNPTTGKSFISIWTSPPSYSNTDGIISFQGGAPSPGINTSSGLVSTVTFRAIAPGKAKIVFLDSSQVLLDDGFGTNVLNSLGEGNYEISILPPEGPKVFSSTHFDLNKWRKNNNPTFSWEKENGVTDFSYMIDLDSQGAPDNESEGGNTSISYSNLDDGIWYFHIKAKKEDVWGGTSHYAVLIDATPPASFSIKVDPSEKTDNNQPIISFITTDALSGIDHYEIKTIDITANRENKNELFFIETASPYRLPLLEIGKYMIVVRVYDKAGNWLDESVKIEIVSESAAITDKGVWRNGELFSWWPLLAAMLLLIILILIVLIVSWKRKRKNKREILQRLTEKKEKIQQDLDKIESDENNQ
jgi:hypothetical protein